MVLDAEEDRAYSKMLKRQRALMKQGFKLEKQLKTADKAGDSTLVSKLNAEFEKSARNAEPDETVPQSLGSDVMEQQNLPSPTDYVNGTIMFSVFAVILQYCNIATLQIVQINV